MLPQANVEHCMDFIPHTSTAASGKLSTGLFCVHFSAHVYYYRYFLKGCVCILLVDWNSRVKTSTVCVEQIRSAVSSVLRGDFYFDRLVHVLVA